MTVQVIFFSLIEEVITFRQKCLSKIYLKTMNKCHKLWNMEVW